MLINPNGYIYQTLLHLRLRDYRGRGGRKIMITREQGVCCKIMSPSNVGNYIHQVSPTWLPKHELSKNDTHGQDFQVNREKPIRPQHYTKNYRQLMTAQKRKISSSQKWAPLFAVHAESWNHIHTNYKNRLSKLYLHILVYVHNTYIHMSVLT